MPDPPEGCEWAVSTIRNPASICVKLRMSNGNTCEGTYTVPTLNDEDYNHRVAAWMAAEILEYLPGTLPYVGSGRPKPTPPLSVTGTT